MSAKNKNIVCIGGGTGTFVALKGLKQYPCHLSAIVTMCDSGGSNRRIRDEFGLLPTSDIRQCLVALSDENGGAGQTLFYIQNDHFTTTFTTKKFIIASPIVLS